MKVGKPVFIAFMDLGKIFNKEDWNKMFDILEKTDLKSEAKKTIYNLYNKQMTVIRIDVKEKENWKYVRWSKTCM